MLIRGRAGAPNSLLQGGGRAAAAELWINFRIFVDALFAEGAVAKGFAGSHELGFHCCLALGKLGSHGGLGTIIQRELLTAAWKCNR